MNKSAKIEAVYGFHPLLALVKQAPEQILEVFVDKSRDDQRMKKLLGLLKETGLSVTFCEKRSLEKISKTVLHQGVVARVKVNGIHKSESDLMRALSDSAADETILVLDSIQDPANLGACLRCADGAGVRYAILPKDKTSGVTAITRKTAAGAADYIDVFVITNLVRSIEQLKQAGFWVVGLADQAQQSVYQYPFKGRIAIIMGSEGVGLRHLTKQTCDQLLSIPMLGQVESLNVSVATGVTLFEIARQKKALSS